MFIILIKSYNRVMILSLINTLNKHFSFDFTMEQVGKEYQIKLPNDQASEIIKSFIQGFVAAWNGIAEPPPLE